MNSSFALYYITLQSFTNRVSDLKQSKYYKEKLAAKLFCINEFLMQSLLLKERNPQNLPPSANPFLEESWHSHLPNHSDE